MAVKPPKLENAAALATRVFDNPAGEEYLAHLRAVFFDKLVYQPGLDALAMAHHDGQRKLVKYIILSVEQGKSGKKPTIKTNTTEEE